MNTIAKSTVAVLGSILKSLGRSGVMFVLLLFEQLPALFSEIEDLLPKKDLHPDHISRN